MSPLFIFHGFNDISSSESRIKSSQKSLHIASAFHCLAIGFNLVYTHFNRMICCMFSLYKLSVLDYLSIYPISILSPKKHEI